MYAAGGPLLRCSIALLIASLFALVGCSDKAARQIGRVVLL